MNRNARVARCHVTETLSINAELSLDRRLSHHLLTVLRLNTGSQIELFNGDGRNYRAVLTTQDKRAQVRVTDVSTNASESPLILHLIQAISRGDRMDTTIQKAVELGVQHIHPVYTRHSISRLDGKRSMRKMEHWRAIVCSAAEQSGRSRITEVSSPLNLTDYLDSLAALSNDEFRWALAPKTPTALPAADLTVSLAYILVGPESGLDQDELASAEAAGFMQIGLGPRILRTETAGPAAIAILQSRFGDLTD